MLEPLAASVLTSFLHVRPPAVPSSASQSALRTMSRALPPGFFTPHPRRAKGKERACASEGCLAYGSSCTEGTSSAVASSSASARPASLRTGVPNRQRLRRLSNQRPFTDSPRGRTPTVHPWAARSGLIQRRHASTQPRLSPGSREQVRTVDLDSHHDTLLSALSDSKADIDHAWDSYEALRAADALSSVRLVDLLSIADRFIAYAGSFHASPTVEDEWEDWGQRVQNLLLDLESRIPYQDDATPRRHWQALMSRALALRGHLDEALEMSRRVTSSAATSTAIGLHEPRRVVAMYRTLVAALLQFRGPKKVLEFVLHEWSTLGTFLDTRSIIVLHHKTARRPIHGVDELRNLIYRIVTKLPSPVDVLADSRDTWSHAWRQRAGELLIDVLIFNRKAHEALAVLREAYKQGLHVPGHQQLSLVRSLAKAGSFEIANPMFANLLKTLKGHHGQLGNQITETGLYLCAMQGNIRQTQVYFRAFRDAGGNLVRGVALLLHAHAVRADATAAVAHFDQYCSEEPIPPGRFKPNIIHYTAVIHAHARRGDRKGMNSWLQKMAAAGHAPDKHIYNVILKAFAEKGEVVSMGSVLDQMRAAGLRPNRVAYTTVIAALAKRKDPVAAEALFRQAVDEGVIFDRTMLTSLMNAHVEAGTWQGVINVFDYLVSRSRGQNADVSIEVYNTLLKAYVLIGAPFSTVFRLFHRLEQMQIRPDDHTFSLVVQSACDGNVLEVAEKLYASVKEVAKNWENGVQLTVYLATIMMSGYLKHDDRIAARRMYEEMIKLGIQPTSTTFSNIMKAYANDRSEESIQIAKNFLKEILSVDAQNYDWVQNARGVGSGLEEVYAPLLNIYTKIERAEEVEALLQDLFDKGGEPTLMNMTALLDVYRRTGNIDGVREVWPQIYKLALQLSDLSPLFRDKASLKSGDPSRPGARRQANLLTIPLSIYIDALSAAGHHMEVAKVWQEMKDEGFVFDSHNWNHLSVVLVRAGEVERAFEVIERVIIPFHRALTSLGVQYRDQEPPSSPLLTDREPTVEDLSRPPTVWPMTAKRRNNMQRLVRKQRIAVNSDNEQPYDFAHTLDILRQVSPQWNTWRPHLVTLQTLAQAVEHLQSGNLVQPVQPASSADKTLQPPQTIEDVEERATKAAEVLERIYEHFPNALDYVLRFIDWRKSHTHIMKKRGLFRR